MVSQCMIPIAEPTVSPPLQRLKRTIEATSNFRFGWQFFELSGVDGVSPGAGLRVLQAMISDQDCHGFLRQTFDPLYDKSFEIGSIHEHCRMSTDSGELENVLAAAANDHLGAYSGHLRDARPAEAAGIRTIFENLGSYQAFQLLPGEVQQCSICAEYNNHLFTNWFYGVAWDWCFVVTWPRRHRAWVGCLTDTD
ncbi:MAG: hypothetical protein GY953_56130 [bacterium]|nr:hypothetical protein [bacterium]